MVTFHTKNRILRPVRTLIFGKNCDMKAEFVFQHTRLKRKTFVCVHLGQISQVLKGILITK